MTTKGEARRAAVAASLDAGGAKPPWRPREYDPMFCEAVVEAGKLGKSKAEIGADLNVSRQTLDNWAKAEPDFLDALQLAHELSLAWWEAVARNGVEEGSKVNASLYNRAVSGRFPAEPYRDRTELTGPNGGPVQTQALADELAALPADKRAEVRDAILQAMRKDAP